MTFSIAGIDIGLSSKTFIVAELSANHNHSFDTAVATIKAAKDAGADAIKIQTYTADTITIQSDKDIFKIKADTLWDGKTLYDLYQEAYTPWDWQPKLKKIAEDIGLVFFSSPFDYTSVDFLEELDVPVYKVASFEITDIPLIEYIAKKNKPIIISTGIARQNEIEEAVNACKNVGNNKIALLKCTSAYPAPLNEMNLKMIPELANTYGIVVGLSDHSLGIAIPVAAAALGAKIIEKHLILDKKLGGPDAAFSIEPAEFKQMVLAIRDVELALGKVTYEISEQIKKSRKFARSLFVVADMKTGDIFSEDNVRSIRPGDGLAPKYLTDILGKKAKIDIERGTPLSWNLIE